MEIAFSNDKSKINQVDMAFQVIAVDVQMRRDFAPAWAFEPWPCSAYKAMQGIRTDLYHPIFYADDIGLDALGFHDDLNYGDPSKGYIYGRVLTPVDVRDATTASHEAVEMRADPECVIFAPMSDGREVAYETGDPVENDAYPITVKIANETRIILVSNFVLPSYFEPGSDGPWDFLGLLKGPAPAMTPGGYLIIRDPRTGEISYVFADRHGARTLAAKRADPATRTGRRILKAQNARKP